MLWTHSKTNTRLFGGNSGVQECLPTGENWVNYGIRRPRPSPRQGRRLGPPQVWSLYFVGLPLPGLPPAPTRHQGHSHSMSQPHCTRQTLQRSPGLKPLKCLKPSAAAWTRHSGHSPLLLRAFQPAVCQSLKMPQTLRGSFDQTLRPQPSLVKGVQACRLPGRLPGRKCLKRSAAASTRHSGPGTQATALCC